MRQLRTLLAFPILLGAAHFGAAEPVADHRMSTALRFEVSLAEGVTPAAATGRMLVVLGRRNRPEPRLTIGRTGMDAPPVLGCDAPGFGTGKSVTLDQNAVIFPIAQLASLPPGDYFAQAIFDTNLDLKGPNSPGNLYSRPRRVHLDPKLGGSIRLFLEQQVPPEAPPAETEEVKFVRLESKLLSAFHGRPMYLRAGVLLPAGYQQEPQRRYPLRVHTGGFGTRYTAVMGMTAFRPRGNGPAAGEPRLVLLHLDGAGPFGDPYQVNSDNNGPYGDAITQELIPYVEQKFRCIGQPAARFLDGASTGGWVSLALQIFYPDFFNGAWGYCPDSVDFRQFELINIYRDDNAYINRFGFERPSMREINGDIRFTLRHECQIENVLGYGNNWTTSGKDWCSWNAVYGPRGADGRPVGLWEPQTGKINRAVVEHWKKYDLRLVLAQNWPTLAPKLRGKLYVWVGDADDYFLNNAVHLLNDFVKQANPPFDGRIEITPRAGHGHGGLTETQMLAEMARRAEQ